MSKFRFLALLVLCSSFIDAAWSQTISGEVYDKSSHTPIQGATVLATESKRATTTDIDGKFTLEITGDKSFEVSYAGYKAQRIHITAATSYRIEMETSSLDQVVVVGYGTQKKANLTGAVTTVDVTKTFQSRPMNDPTKALQGIAPGLSITYSNGGLTASPAINIRGVGSINGSSKPLILVDNVETSDLSIINPNDIESVSVLKDAASTSIYGARAAFGVILIKTKSGKKNQRTTVTYNNYFAWSKPTVLPDFADPVPELTGMYEAAKRANATANPEVFGMQLLKLRDGIVNWREQYAANRNGMEMVENEDFKFDPADNRMYFYRVWDPKDIMLKDYTNQQMHNLSIQGGSEKIAYYTSFGYSNDGGIFKLNPDQVKKYNITAGINASVTDWLDMNVRTMYRNYEYDYPFSYQEYWYYFWRWGAYFPLGTWNGKHFRHVPAYLAQAQTNSVIDNYTRVDVGATLKLTKNLSIRADYTIGRDNLLRHEVGGQIMAWDFWGAAGYPRYTNVAQPTQDRVTNKTGRYLVNTLNAYATYQNTFFEDHDIKLTAGVNTENNQDIYYYAERRALLDPDKGELALATGDQIVSQGTDIPYNRINAYAGYFGRINYSFKNRYLLELNGRYDGSSTFSPQDRWAFFSSASAGWRLSEEAFMQFAKPVVSDLKLRASYGSVGNQDVGNQQGVGTAWYIPTMGNAPVNWITPTNSVRSQTIGSPRAVANSLTWETVKTLDIGLDARFLNNHLGITFDWYERNTEGMLANTSVPATFGTDGPKINAGNFRNRGWEISIDANYDINKDLKVYGTFVLSDNKTVFTKWDNPSMLITQNYVGKTYGEIWGFETEGYFTSSEDVTKSPSQVALQNGNFVYGAGDIKYKNLNGDTVISGGKLTVADPGDLKVIGNDQPRYQYSARIGATWKNFDAEIFIQGVGKRDYWGIGDISIPMYRGGPDILYAHQLDYWTPDNPNARYPRNYVGNTATKLADFPKSGNNYYPQTKYLLNLAYCRLKNVAIGYTLPKNILSRYKIQKVRVFVNGQNLAEIADVGLPLDPEITYGESSFLGRTFPFQRSYSFGLQLTF
jgi:TonB-linked SusC/RagA family outer membrane protein